MKSKEFDFDFQYVRNRFARFLDCIAIIFVFKVSGGFPKTKNHLIFYRKERFNSGLKAFEYILKTIRRYFDAEFEAFVIARPVFDPENPEFVLLVISHGMSEDTIVVQDFKVKKLSTSYLVIRK